MEINNRTQQLLQLLKEKKYSSVASLGKLLFASESTIRRDLHRLAGQGLIRRTRGGAFFAEETHIEWPFLYKNKDNIEKKQHIANLAIDFVRDSQTLFIDSSSTSLFLAKKLSEKKELTVLTNGITTAGLLSENTEALVYCACGRVYLKRSSINGPETCEYIARHSADIAFLSCRGINADWGITDFSEEESMVKRSFQKHAKQTILLADSTKFEKSYFQKTFDFRDINVVISDQCFPPEIAARLKEAGTEMVW